MQPEPRQVARLRDYALRHLARFPASAARLTRVLERRCRKLVAAGELEPDVVPPLVAGVVKGLLDAGLVDDRVYAEGRSRTLARRGRSQARIRADLGADGVERDLARRALDAALPTTGDRDEALAVRYAKRRGLGPFRSPGERAVRRERDLRSLLRQGFPLVVARTVIDADDAEMLDDPLA